MRLVGDYDSLLAVRVAGVEPVDVAVVPVAVGRFLSLTFVTVSVGEEELARGEVCPSSLPLGSGIGTVALCVTVRRSDQSGVRPWASMSIGYVKLIHYRGDGSTPYHRGVGL